MKKLLLYFLLTYSYYSLAQNDSIQISTDRPGFSDYPKTIPAGYFQIEAGFTFESETVTPTDRFQLLSWNNTLLKYGLIKGVELRLSQNYQSQRLLVGGSAPEFSWQSYSGPIVVGTKIDLFREADLVPQTGILVEYGINTSANSNSFLRIQLSTKYQLNSAWYAMANLGMDNINSYNRLRFTLNTGYSINEKLSIYAEIYGFRSEVRTPLNYFDAGFTYLLNPKFQLDLHAGFDLVQQVNTVENYQQSFISMGLGYLFKITK